MDLDLSPDDSDDASEDFSGVSDNSGDSDISEIEDEQTINYEPGGILSDDDADQCCHGQQ